MIIYSLNNIQSFWQDSPCVSYNWLACWTWNYLSLGALNFILFHGYHFINTVQDILLHLYVILLHLLQLHSTHTHFYFFASLKFQLLWLNTLLVNSSGVHFFRLVLGCHDLCSSCLSCVNIDMEIAFTMWTLCFICVYNMRDKFHIYVDYTYNI